MENQAVDAALIAGSLEGAHFGMMEMFLRADVVVKSVMISLILASIWCWAIIFEKMLTVRRLNKRSSEFEQAFWSGQSLDELYERISSNPRDPMSAVFRGCDARMAAGIRRDDGEPESGCFRPY